MLNYIIQFKAERNQEIEIIEPVEEMDFGMMDVVSKPQRKLFTHKRSELFASEANYWNFIGSL